MRALFVFFRHTVFMFSFKYGKADETRMITEI